MPRHTFRVSSTEIVHIPEKIDSEGFRRPGYDLKSIRCKVPNDDMRPWGRQLYAFLGILFVPILIDSFWLALFNHHSNQLERDDTKTYSTFRGWVSRPRNILLLPITFPFVVYYTVLHAIIHVVIITLTTFIPFRYTPNGMRFPFAYHDPLIIPMFFCRLLEFTGVSLLDELEYFSSYVSNTAEKNDSEEHSCEMRWIVRCCNPCTAEAELFGAEAENDSEDSLVFIVSTDPAYEISVDQHFKMRFPPFLYWCFIRCNSLATGGYMESQV